MYSQDGARPALFQNCCVVLCIVCFVSFYVLFVCKCVLYFCLRVTTQLQLTNISYRIISYHIISYHIISYHIIRIRSPRTDSVSILRTHHSILYCTVGVYSYEKLKYSCVTKFRLLLTLRNVAGKGLPTPHQRHARSSPINHYLSPGVVNPQQTSLVICDIRKRRPICQLKQDISVQSMPDLDRLESVYPNVPFRLPVNQGTEMKVRI